MARETKVERSYLSNSMLQLMPDNEMTQETNELHSNKIYTVPHN